MMLLNIEYIPGKRIEALGLVKGTTVYSKSFGKDFMAGMKTLVGGEIEGYTDLLRQARQIATKQLPHPRDVEDILHNNSAADHIGQLAANNGDDRDKCVFDAVADNHGFFP